MGGAGAESAGATVAAPGRGVARTAPHRKRRPALGEGVWAVPDVPAFAEGVTGVITMADRGGGQAMTLHATGRGDQGAARFRAMFTAARSADWGEFLADGGKFDAGMSGRSPPASSPWPSWKRRSSRSSGYVAGTGT